MLLGVQLCNLQFLSARAPSLTASFALPQAIALNHLDGSERICPASKSHPFWLTLAGQRSSPYRPHDLGTTSILKYPACRAGPCT